jgi:hypothetical protein
MGSFPRGEVAGVWSWPFSSIWCRDWEFVELSQPPIQWVPGVPSLGVKRQGRESDHLPPSSAEVKNAWSYTSTSPIRLHGVVLS